MRDGQLLTFWYSVPEKTRNFLVRALFVFLLWKIVYHLLLYPYRIPDESLTRITASVTAWFYSLVHNGAPTFIREEIVNGFSSFSLFVNEVKAVRIQDACNGLELYALYIGFLLCFPVSTARLLSFLFIGMSSIFVLNIVRCYGLSWLYLHQYSIADFAHHYLFKMVIYAMVFCFWMLYLKNYFSKHAQKNLDSGN